MRTLCLLLLLFISCSWLQAQTANIEYHGDPLPEKDKRKIEQILHHEVNFYSQFGLPDTLRIQLYVFEDRKEAQAYLEEINVPCPMATSGIYIPKLQKAVILGREAGRERSLMVIYHELSHHFVRQILGNIPPSWINEGLSEYFEHCDITKKGVRHTFTEYEQGRIRTMYMLGEVDLLQFINSNSSNFMKRQRTDEQYSYILSHALVTFWVDKVPIDIFKKLIAVLQKTKDTSKVSECIEQVYPGGFKVFEQDFTNFCK